MAHGTCILVSNFACKLLPFTVDILWVMRIFCPPSQSHHAAENAMVTQHDVPLDPKLFPSQFGAGRGGAETSCDVTFAWC